ncbi:MAG: hypothetical protein ACYTEZ_19415, partial [Planctomycetota bacterium]
MIATTRIPCPECGQANAPEAFRCLLCGRVLRPVEEAPRAATTVIHRRLPTCEPLTTTLKFLLIGAVLAPVFTFTPLLRFMGWFLGSLCHEIGHTAMAWLAGTPAYPAIRLDGHAVAVHGEQYAWLCVIVWFVLAYVAWQFRAHRRAVWLWGGLTLVYPLFAFTGLREFFFLLGGHLGELVFATVFFWRALVGGFSRSRAERIAYATCAWFLLGRNLWLTGGLMWDEGVRTWYRSHGSLGLTNDYLRLAHEVMGVGLGTVAFLMFVVALAVLPVAWILSRSR